MMKTCSLVVLMQLGTAAAGQAQVGSFAVQRVDHVDTTAAEPMPVRHPNGTLFVAGYGSPWANTIPATDTLFTEHSLSRLWKSADDGKTWSRVNLGRASTGVVGNSDVALSVARDGSIYFVTLRYDSLSGKWQGRRISIGVSHDAGATWAWKVLDARVLDDRPWVAVAPNGTAHTVWSDGAGVMYTHSVDRGISWSKPARISTKGGTGFLSVGPRGEVAVRVIPLSAAGPRYDPGVDSVLVSTNEGSTWQRYTAPGGRDWAKQDTPGFTPRWVEPLAWDAAGNLFSLWTRQRDVWVARSADRGATWKETRIATEQRLTYYPYVIARGDGDLFATWFVGKGDSLQWRAASIDAAAKSAPRITRSGFFTSEAYWPDTTRHNKPTHDTAGEYVAATFLGGGTVGIATPMVKPGSSGFSWWRLR